MISRLLHLILVSVTLLLAPSCSEQSIQEAKLRRELHIPADMPIRDLGTVELLVNSPRVIDLGDGKVVTVTTYGITNDLLQISVVHIQASASCGTEGTAICTSSNQQDHA